ncbi:hypothetical protein QBC47DRAFT_177752 [Echria macrotheca]|uniref:Uncharacterized protein n=1 Tax=Echria macrotheca TaxID=438768 RepID=A0AAJ0FDK0_9PEZI|nr:hypothetical protein QBC47DRAFT_177752 [Echria macrotheca]
MMPAQSAILCGTRSARSIGSWPSSSERRWKWNASRRKIFSSESQARGVSRRIDPSGMAAGYISVQKLQFWKPKARCEATTPRSSLSRPMSKSEGILDQNTIRLGRRNYIRQSQDFSTRGVHCWILRAGTVEDLGEPFMPTSGVHTGRSGPMGYSFPSAILASAPGGSPPLLSHLAPEVRSRRRRLSIVPLVVTRKSSDGL